MTKLRSRTNWAALTVSTVAALVSLLFPPPSHNPVHAAIGAVAIWLGACLLTWGVGLTIETEGSRLRARLQGRWTSESNGA